MADRTRLLRESERRLVIGYLQGHGPAPYRHRRAAETSYFVSVLSDRGRPYTVWGKDLERAILQSRTQPKQHEKIGIRRVAREPVTLTGQADGGQGPRAAYRTRWEVEKVEFFVERARRARQVRDAQTDVRATVRAQPELKSTFLSIRSAEELAAKRIADPKDRERFLKLVREAIAGSIQQGEPLPEVRMRDHARQPKPAPSPPLKTRNGPTR